MKQAFIGYQLDTKKFINKNNFELTLGKTDKDQILTKYIKDITTSLQSLESHLDLEQIDALCQRIHDTENVSIT
ncbi:hypothetical protein A5819_001916 [Enterococcus sp. 7E2_DIV0204]|nr:hypothetical protein A5819_001916 [Enterococcus sp. 7E2_DIV0204]OTP51878.1 hypothetical protein A5884_001073 [Enterococcus sp. 7D2_DIV0200]